MKNLIKFLLTGLALFILGTAVSEASGYDPGVPEVIISNVAVATADFTALKNYIGTFDKQLLSQTLNGLDIAKDMNVMYGVRAPRTLTKVTIGAGIRPMNFNVDNVKQAGRKFSSRTITPREAMKIFKINPDEYREMWMSEMHAPGAKREPFAAYLWRKEFEKLASEINDEFYFMEYHADAPAYSAAATYDVGDYINFEEEIFICTVDTTAGQSPTTTPASWEDVTHKVICDGPGTIIAKIIEDDEIEGSNIINTGAITDADACDQFELMYRSMPSRYRGKIQTIYCSHNAADSYKEHYKTKYPHSTIVNEQQGNAPLYLYGSGRQCIIKPVTWMQESGRLILSNKENLVFGTDQLNQVNGVSKLIEEVHGYKGVAKWIMCSQVRDTEVLWVNDQV